MNKAKALLDSLMGPSRDKAAEDRKGDDFLQRNICKHYLIGFCPNSVLSGKIPSFEKCKKIHSEACVEELAKHADKDRYRKDYAESLARLLSELISKADFHAGKNKKERRPKETVTRIPDHLKHKIDTYEETKRNLLQRGREKAAAGDGTGQEADEHEADRAQVQIDSIRKTHTSEFPGEEVCEACGVLYLLASTTNRQESAEEHFSSEAHKAYVRVREKLAELKTIIAECERNRDAKKESEQAKGKDDKKERKDQDDGSDKEKDVKDKDDKKSKKEKDHDSKEKERSKDRDRDKDDKKRKKDSEDEKKRSKSRCRERDKKRKNEKDGSSDDRKGSKDRDKDDKRRKKERGRSSEDDKKRSRDRDRDADDKKRKKEKGRSSESNRKRSRGRDRDKDDKKRKKEKGRSSDDEKSRSRARDKKRKGRDASRDRDRRKRSRS